MFLISYFIIAVIISFGVMVWFLIGDTSSQTDQKIDAGLLIFFGSIMWGITVPTAIIIYFFVCIFKLAEKIAKQLNSRE